LEETIMGQAVEVEHTACPGCNSDAKAILFSSGDRRHPLPGIFTMVRCLTCGHVYLDPRPTAASLAQYYPEDYSPFQGGRGWTKRLTTVLRQIEARALARLIRPGRSVLEVGCAAGDLLAPLNALGLETRGVEVSPMAAEMARAKGLDVHTGTLATAPLADRSVDCVVMRNVIEHLPEPREDLLRAQALLRPGGVIILTTSNCASLDCRIFGADWYGFDVPRHLNVFSAASLAKLLTSVGFERPAVSYSLVPTHWIVSLRYTLERRFGRRPLWRVLSAGNPMLLAAFLPIAFAQKLLGNGGRMRMLATKPEQP
jgi:SAM-dependent methyltransferase